MLAFTAKIGKTYSSSVSFMPSRELLIQILKCEQLMKYFENRPVVEISKQELLARILIGDQQTENVDKVKIDKNPDSHLLRSVSASCLETTQLEEEMTQIGLINSELKDLF